jgi:hypothetical protein
MNVASITRRCANGQARAPLTGETLVKSAYYAHIVTSKMRSVC